MTEFSSVQDHRLENDKAYISTGDSYDLVIEYVDIASPTGRKVPTDRLLVGCACEKTTLSKTISDSHLPEFHVSDDTSVNLAEGPAMRSVRLLLCVPPLWCLETLIGPYSLLHTA